MTSPAQDGSTRIQDILASLFYSGRKWRHAIELIDSHWLGEYRTNEPQLFINMILLLHSTIVIWLLAYLNYPDILLGICFTAGLTAILFHYLYSKNLKGKQWLQIRLQLSSKYQLYLYKILYKIIWDRKWAALPSMDIVLQFQGATPSVTTRWHSCTAACVEAELSIPCRLQHFLPASIL